MTWQIYLGIFLLLLPVPLAVLIPARVDEKPDPYVVRRARYAAALFPLIVGVIYLVQFAYLFNLTRELQPDFARSAFGLFNWVPIVWVPMAWIFLANLVYVLRKPASKSLSDSTKRDATLVPRHKFSPIPAWSWLSLAGAFVLTSLAMAISLAPLPAISWTLLAAAALMLIIGPWIVRQNLLSAEPGFAGAHAAIQSAYGQRRCIRSWWLFTIITIGALYKTLVAVLFALSNSGAMSGRVLISAAGLIMLVSVAFYVLDRRMTQSISHLIGDALNGDS